MPGVHRVSDPVSNHPCPPYGPAGSGQSSIAATGCSTVFANGLPVVTLGNLTTRHLCIPPKGSPGVHSGVYIASRTVMAGGAPVQAMGDVNSCSAVLIGGSPNVLVGA